MTTTILVKTPDARLRPNLPEPRTVAETKLYIAAQKDAYQANLLLDQVHLQAKKSRAIDNTFKDLNSEKNIIVSSGKAEINDLNVISSMVLDAQDGKALSYESETSGYISRGAGSVGKSHHDTMLYHAEPRLELTSRTRSGSSTQETTLREDANGLIIFETKVLS